MGWGYYDDYAPYVPVATRLANAAKEAPKRLKRGEKISPVKIEGLKITKSFWGNSWSANLEAYSDYANRLPRGRTYVRNGSVVHLQIEKGQITALVSGSELYEIKITISELASKSWQDIKTESAGQIGSLVELLQGKLSKQVMEIVTRRDTGLFPKPREIKMRCSCPDSAGMCKHLAAVMYGVGARLDQQPELLFTLRHVDHLELIQGAGQADIVGKPSKSGKKTIAAGDLADMFGIEMASVPEQVAAPIGNKEARLPKAKRATKPKMIGPTDAEIRAKAIEAYEAFEQKIAEAAPAKPRAKPGSKLASSTTSAADKPARKGQAAKSTVPAVANPIAESAIISKVAKKSGQPASEVEKPTAAVRRKSTSVPSVKSLARSKSDSTAKMDD